MSDDFHEIVGHVLYNGDWDNFEDFCVEVKDMLPLCEMNTYEYRYCADVYDEFKGVIK
ncbi:MAG: hypothetical protein ACHQU0_03775 [Candidatus Paceibacteria bacterium]